MTPANTFLFVAALLPATLLIAQAPAPRPVTDANKAVAVHADHATASDAILATWLHSACTNHIALANLAVKQSKNAELCAFAQKLVDDHTAFAAKLLPFTLVPAVPSTKVGEAAAAKSGATAVDAKVTPPAAGSFDHAAVIRDLGARCLQSETKELAAKTGPEFDRCFLHMEVGAHQKGTDMVEVFKNYASPRLRPTLDEALTLLASHQQRAQALHQKCSVPVVDGVGGSR